MEYLIHSVMLNLDICFLNFIKGSCTLLSITYFYNTCTSIGIYDEIFGIINLVNHIIHTTPCPTVRCPLLTTHKITLHGGYGGVDV